MWARAVLERVDNPTDRRESRFWELLYILKPNMQRSPIRAGWPWLLAATRAWVANNTPRRDTRT